MKKYRNTVTEVQPHGSFFYFRDNGSTSNKSTYKNYSQYQLNFKASLAIMAMSVGGKYTTTYLGILYLLDSGPKLYIILSNWWMII